MDPAQKGLTQGTPPPADAAEPAHVLVDGRCTHPDCQRAYPGSGSRGRKGPLFYALSPERWAERQAIVSLVDGFGTHLICPRRACARAGRCRDGHMGALPFCFWHYRGTLRFVAKLMETRWRAQLASGEDEPAAHAKRPAGTGGGRPSMLGRLRASGWPIERLRRPLDAGPDQYSWEHDPDARAMLAEARAGEG